MTPSPNKIAVVLLSGGLDSATVLAIAKDQGFTEIHALSFDYGQRHRVELDAAKKIGQAMNVQSHRWANIDLRVFGGSALTADLDVPKDRNAAQMQDQIPITYVPARNTIFLSFALALAEVVKSQNIFLGVNAVDYSGYPDCRPEYIQAFQTMANLATKAGVQGSPMQIHTPLMQWTKPQIISKGLALNVDYKLTHSCYDPDPAGQACQHCDSCLIRIEAFNSLGMTDPALSKK